MTPVLDASRLTKRFGARTVLAGVDLDVHRGECIGIEGATGSGRTTLLRVFAMQQPPTSGILEIDGLDPAARLESARRKVALIAVPAAEAAGLEAREWLRFVVSARGGVRLDGSEITDSLTRVGLSGRTPVSGLSRRLRRRLDLEAAWLSGADLMLVDGASDNDDNDDNADTALAAWMSRAIAAGRAVIAVVNASSDTQAVCTHLVRLHDGRLSVDRAAPPSTDETS